ncbi:MAG: type II secretion system protein [Planctomycetia bacterium]|nr:type II secretion system protein [Planctomycetia bacterium]
MRRIAHDRMSKRVGFTLVELLTVITIIGILSAISITTVRASIASARATQTRTTIAKIDAVLTPIYEKYQYRRIALDDTNLAIESKLDRVPARIFAMRDLLRCDLPCSEAELLEPSAIYNAGAGSLATSLQKSYITSVNRALNKTSVVGDMGSGNAYTANAELLYLVITNADPEARLAFTDREIADTDGNGLFEFVDGWGRPICWMRWAPGLTRSDRQPQSYGSGATIDKEDADPFDPLGFLDNWRQSSGDYYALNGREMPAGWFLVPYVFSAGPDGKYGLVMPDVVRSEVNGDEEQGVADASLRSVSDMLDPFSGLSLTFGEPDSSDKAHLDNLDNHTLVR